MGCGQSVEQKNQVLQTLYQRFAEKHGKVGGAEGGCGCVGGYMDLADYSQSVYSQTKEKLIRDLATEMGSAIGMSKEKVMQDDIEKVVKAFKNYLPAYGKGFAINKKENQDKCLKLAKALNKVYGSQVIDEKKSPEEICQDTAEVLHTVFTGLHSEFLLVAGDVRKVLRNLEILQSYVSTTYDKLLAELNAKNPEENAEKVALKKMYEIINQEIKRQMTIMANLIGQVIDPQSKSIIQVFEDGKEFYGLVSNLDQPGSDKFRRAISNLYSGVGDIAYSAMVVDSALKDLGLSVADFKKTEGLQSLKDLVYKHISSKKPATQELEKMLIAADVLYKNSLFHDDIVKYLENKKGGDEDWSLFDEFRSDATNPFRGRRFPKTGDTLKKQMQKKGKMRDVLFATFKAEFSSHYDRIIYDIDLIGKKIGTEIPITDELEEFVASLENFKEIHPDRRNIHQALTGYYTDPASKKIKSQFMQGLKDIADKSKSMSSSAFKSLVSDIENMLKFIDNFNDTFGKQLVDITIKKPTQSGGDEMSSESGSESESDMECNVQSAIYGSYGGGAEPKMEDYKYFGQLNKTVKVFNYHYRVAHVKSRLKIASQEHSGYTKEYENIVGEEGAFMVDDFNRKCNDLVVDDRVKDLDDDRKSAYRYLMEYSKTAHIDLVEAAQALDLYLSHFTADIEKNPDILKDFVNILEQIEIVAKWFTEKSGDNLAKVFESMEKLPLDSDESNWLGKDHYYNWVNQAGASGLTAKSIENNKQAKEFINRLEKAFMGMRALDNIMSIFSKVSHNPAQRITTFMSPAIISKCLMRYMVASSFVVSKDGGNIRVELSTNEKKTHSFLPAQNNYIHPDNMFEMCMKSIITKILVVVDTFNLFKRPLKEGQELVNANNSLRQILGGADEEPKVIKEATELYIRLPLMAEWYREVFDFKEKDEASQDKLQTDPLISVIPNIDGIFSDFIKLVFLEGGKINDGGYTTDVLNGIINSVNEIYNKYKGAKDPVEEVISAFVAEMNRRYGLIYREDINNYYAAKYKHLAGQQYDDADEEVDFDILKSEYSYGRAPAPSARFTEFIKDPKKVQAVSSLQFKEQVEKFRERIEENLKLSDMEFKFEDVSLHNYVKTLKTDISKSEKEEQLKLIKTAVQGVSKYGNLNKHAIVMFHEYVINPITILNQMTEFCNHMLLILNAFHSEPKKLIKGSIITNEYLAKITEMKTKIEGTGKLSVAISLLTQLQCDLRGMIEIKFNTSGKQRYPTINVSKLENICSSLFQQVKNAMQVFRGQVPNDMIRTYEDCILNIDNELFDKFFSNKYGLGFSDANAALKDAFAVSDKLNAKEFNDNLIAKLNSLIVLYVQQLGETVLVADAATNQVGDTPLANLLEGGNKGYRLYLPLIEKFVNGYNSPQILGGQPGILTPGNANMLKAIALASTYRSSTKIAILNEPNLDMIPAIYKEKMRVMLPALEKVLNIIDCHCKFMDELKDGTGVIENTGYPDFNSIAQTALSLNKCIVDVQRDLSDVPLFAETYKDSIADFKARNGKLPFMPLSWVSALFSNKFSNVVAPGALVIGDSNFKMNYAVRGLLSLNQKVSLDYAPGVKELVKQYNDYVGAGKSLGPKVVQESFENSVHLYRFLLDMKFLSDDKLLTEQMLNPNNNACNTILSISGNNEFFNNSDNLMQLIESDRPDKTADRLVGALSPQLGAAATGLYDRDRKYMRVYNILDLNVVPINFHALQREIPFANLINYAYTFDQMIKEKFARELINSARSNLYNNAGLPNTRHHPEDMLVRLLINYNGSVSDAEFKNEVYRLMVGNTSLGLNRPKYLSDQLWNKSLLQTQYNKQDNPFDLNQARVDSSQGYPNISVGDNRQYVAMDDSSQPKSRLVLTNASPDVGFDRFNTNVVRVINWLVNAQRCVRLLMRKQLDWVASPVVRDSDAIAEEVTEYKENKEFDINGF